MAKRMKARKHTPLQKRAMQTIRRLDDLAMEGTPREYARIKQASNVLATAVGLREGRKSVQKKGGRGKSRKKKTGAGN